MEAGRSSSAADELPSLEFRLLGPLEVRSGRNQLPLGGGRPRALLAFLLVHRGETVTIDRIVDGLWGESPPPTARHMVEVYVSNLRGALGKERFVREAVGYSLLIDPDELDAARFERLSAEGREALRAGEADIASTRLAEALELWRGPALADFAYEAFAEVESRRLEELRLDAEEDRIDAELALGHAAGLAGRVEELVARAPLRERRHGQLMRALAGAGRQADALAAYRAARTLLVEQLGIEPSEELRRLERAILDQDESVAGSAGDRRDKVPRATRRVVTVLFAELIDGGEGADPEVAHSATARSLAPARDTVEQHGGRVEELPGGTVMAVFGSPVAHEDDALRALRAAAELRELGLALRLGVEAGEALTAGGEVSGEVVRVASRLREVAAEGEIVVGDQARRLSEDAVRLEPHWDEQLTAWRLLEVMPADGRTPWTSPFVGRAEELAVLLESFELAVAAERARLVTVLGEPGIGKSRLGQALADRVRSRARVLVGRCLPYGESITYWPLRMIVREAGGVSYDSIRALLGDAGHADAIAVRVAGAMGLVPEVHPVEEIRWAVVRLLEALARKRPIVVGFDDLQWADPALLDLVDHVADTAQAPILVLCLARAELLEDRRDWGAGSPDGRILTLAPLSKKESSELLSGLNHTTTGLDEAERRHIVAAADGNPLFLEQLAAYAAERNGDDREASLPTSLRTLLAARLDRLHPSERIVVECAAVVGRVFWVDAVRDLVPAETASALTRHLDSLTRRDLLQPWRTSVPFMRAFRFRHALIQEAAYRSLPKGRRAEAHERLAAWIEGAPAAAVGARDRRVGHHLERACVYRAELGSPADVDDDLAERAARHLAAAAGRASARGNAASAASLFGRASALLPRGDRVRLRLLPLLGVELLDAGDRARAETTFAEAIDDAVEAGDRGVELRARLELAAVHGFVTPSTAAVEIDRLAADAIPVFEQDGDQSSLARLWHVLGYVEIWRVRWDAAGAAFERALAHAREAQDRREEASCIRWLGWSLVFGSTPVPEAIERCEALLAGLDGNRDAAAGLSEALASLQAMLGRFDEARELYRRVGRAYADLGQRRRLARLTVLGARIELLAGERATAVRELRAAYEIYESCAESESLASVAASLARVCCTLGRHDEAAELASVAERTAGKGDVTTQVRYGSARARVLAAAGEAGEAEELARGSVALTEGSEFPDWRADAFLDLAEVLRSAGRHEEANAAVRDAQRLLEAKGNLVAVERLRSLQAPRPSSPARGRAGSR
jgi:DNA-binding SARP family transcriptional activator